MFGFDRIKKIFDSKKYKVYKVNIGLEIVKTGIQFANYERLQEFMDDNDITTLFLAEYYDAPDDYLISEDTLRKSNIYINDSIFELIKNDIEKHNRNIMKINFDIASAAIIACLFEGKYCFVYLENDKEFDENILVDPQEKLIEICDNNMNSIEKRSKEDKKQMEELKKDVKEFIINDKEFLLCTNKQLRKNYTRILFKQRLDKKKYKLLMDHWVSNAPVGVYTDAIDFVEMIWNELKNSHSVK